MMEGVIFCCPPAWRKLLPPGVLGAERAEALAEQYWPLLVLTRRGCGELGDTAALCRVLLVPGDCTAPLERITAAFYRVPAHGRYLLSYNVYVPEITAASGRARRRKKPTKK